LTAEASFGLKSVVEAGTTALGNSLPKKIKIKYLLSFEKINTFFIIFTKKL